MEYTAQNKAFALQPGVPVQQLHWHLLRSREESLMSGSQLLHMSPCMLMLTPRPQICVESIALLSDRSSFHSSLSQPLPL